MRWNLICGALLLLLIHTGCDGTANPEGGIPTTREEEITAIDTVMIGHVDTMVLESPIFPEVIPYSDERRWQRNDVISIGLVRFEVSVPEGDAPLSTVDTIALGLGDPMPPFALARVPVTDTTRTATWTQSPALQERATTESRAAGRPRPYLFLRYRTPHAPRRVVVRAIWRITRFNGWVA